MVGVISFFSFQSAVNDHTNNFGPKGLIIVFKFHTGIYLFLYNQFYLLRIFCVFYFVTFIRVLFFL